MDEDQIHRGYQFLTIMLGVVALLSWALFVYGVTTRLWLAVGVTSTVGCATFRILSELKPLHRRG